MKQKKGSTGSRVLNLTLKKQYFDEILAGTKKKEYRELKQHWISRLIDSATGEIRRFDYVVFKNGYGKDAPSFAIVCEDITIEKDIETPIGRGDFFVISLGSVVCDMEYRRREK